MQESPQVSLEEALYVSDSSVGKKNPLLDELKSQGKTVKTGLKKTKTVVKKTVPQALALSLKNPVRIDWDYIPPRFDVDDPAAMDYLKDNGYVVIKEVLSQEECLEIRGKTWDWLERLSFPNDVKIQRDMPQTWHSCNWPADPKTGIVFSFGIGQTQFAWQARSAPKVKKSFEKIWGTDDLIVSFDGINLFRPFKYHSKWRTQSGWWHTDQNARREQTESILRCVQGLIPLLDVTRECGGLCVIPKSHNVHLELVQRLRWPGGDFVPIPRQDPFFIEHNRGIVVQCKAGDLCLWDSRTIHANEPSDVSDHVPGTKKNRDWPEPKEGWDLIRNTVYVCMTPRYKATNEVLKRRNEGFKKHVTSTHWPHLYAFRMGAGYVDQGFKLSEYQLDLVGRPRGWFEEFLWQRQYGSSFNLTHMFECAVYGTMAYIAYPHLQSYFKNWWFSKKT